MKVSSEGIKVIRITDYKEKHGDIINKIFINFTIKAYVRNFFNLSILIYLPTKAIEGI